jgi:hypothetical protein
MPYQIIDNGTHFMIVNKDTGAVKSRHSTLEKARLHVQMLDGYKPKAGIEKAKKKVIEEEKIRFY